MSFNHIGIVLQIADFVGHTGQVLILTLIEGYMSLNEVGIVLQIADIVRHTRQVLILTLIKGYMSLHEVGIVLQIADFVGHIEQVLYLLCKNNSTKFSKFVRTVKLKFQIEKQFLPPVSHSTF